MKNGARFVIDKKVSIPAPRSGNRYPWEQMKVGDSFLIPCGPEARLRTQSNILTAARCRRKKGERHTSRIEETGIRVWRIE